MMGRQRRARRWGLATILFAATIMALPGPWGPSARGSAPAPATGWESPSGPGVAIAPAYQPSPGVVPLGPLPATIPIEVAVALAPPDPAGLASEVALQYAPGTPEFGHPLTPGAIADRFGPSVGDYQKAVSYFRSEGLSVRESPDRTLLFVLGPSGTIAQAFGTSFERYGRGTHWFFSHPTTARLPEGLPWSGVVGLGNATPIVPYATHPMPAIAPSAAPSAASCPSSSYVTPCLAASAYNLTALLQAGSNGTGYRIGIVDNYDGSEPQTQLVRDLANFSKLYSVPYGNVSFAYPVPTSTNLNSTQTGWGVESALDLQWSRAMAPGASIVMALAPNPTTGLYASVDWLVAHHAVDVITMSWGEPDVGIFNAFSGPCPNQCNASSDGSYTILHPVLQAAAAEGISVFAASGDCGAASGTSGVSTGYPASDPFVVGVGGTDLTLNSTGAYVSEGGWTGNSSGAYSPGCVNQGGSGGGFSPFPRPYWQRGPGLPTTPATRGEPDVSILAASPGAAMVYSGQFTTAGGTSLSSPMWAGLAADADSHAKAALGFLNPSLYTIFRNASHKNAFHDVTTGWNGYSAGPGWDPVTGIGTPDAGNLLPLLSRSNVTQPGILLRLTASPRFGPVPLSITLRALASGGSGSYAFYDFDFGDGNATMTPSPQATHTYLASGVYVGRAVVFDTNGNSSSATPLAIVAGGGGALKVTLNATPARPAVGSPVTFRANATGGRTPYTFRYDFGDGAYLQPTNQALVLHPYGAPGGYCALVVVSDSASPPDGGASSSVAIAVGGGSAPTCPSSAALTVSLTPVSNGLDLPGDFAFRENVSGGIAPYSATITADDPYASTCHCGLFSTVGPHLVRATVADSLVSESNATANVTVYPALAGRFTASAALGPAPLSVLFSAALSGGHLADANLTLWRFGDGTNATGAAVGHLYAVPGWYVASALAIDAGGGRASEAFLIDVYPTGPVPSAVVTATIAPALEVGAGSLVHYSARVGGSSGPYLVLWTLGNNGSAFGENVTQSYPYETCALNGSCLSLVRLAVRNVSGTWINLSIPLSPEEKGNESALLLTDSIRQSNGTTPFALSGSARSLGMPAPKITWSFGEGANSTGTSAAHTYLSPGNYTVTVSASDAYGDRLVHTHAVVVRGPQRYAPLISGGANTTGGLAPLPVGFQVSASGGIGPPYNFSWSFGDGAGAYGPAVRHTYASSGLYQAAVTVVDRIGDPALQSYLIQAYAVTPVGLAVVGLPETVPAGGRIVLSLLASASCGSDSLPGCATAGLSVRVSILPASSSASAGSIGNVTPIGVGGRANVTIAAPRTPGPYEVSISVITRGYSGSVREPLLVNAGTNVSVPPPPPPPRTDLWVSAGVGAAVAGAAVAIALLLRAQRRDRIPPRSS